MTTLVDYVQEIGQRLSDPEFVKETALLVQNTNPDPTFSASLVWDDLSLANGYPSLVLLFSALQKRGLSEDGIAHQYVLKIKEKIEAEGLFDLSLFGGISGLCFAIQQASMGGQRYQKMLEALNTFLLDGVDRMYLAPIKEKRRKNLPCSARLYDPIQGICGIGRYALENIHDSRFLDLVTNITKSLISLSQPFTYKGQQIPGWFLSPNDSLNAKNRSLYPNGTFNLGLAHGVTGILAFLSIAYLRGIQLEGQKEAIDRISTWIRDRSFVGKSGIMWPYCISWEEEVQGKPFSKIDSRDAWCYGVPGIARTLFVAGKAIGNQDLKSFAATAFRNIFLRSPEKWNLPGPTLCHGIAGLLLITREMSKEEGLEDLDHQVKELENLLLSFYKSSSPWGFQDIELGPHGKSYEVNKPGFLEGTAGVLLTILNSSDDWHLPLLIHG